MHLVRCLVKYREICTLYTSTADYVLPQGASQSGLLTISQQKSGKIFSVRYCCSCSKWRHGDASCSLIDACGVVPTDGLGYMSVD